MISESLKKKIGREAEERYPRLKDESGFIDEQSEWNKHHAIKREVWIECATEYAGKIEALRVEVEKRIADYDERMVSNRLFFTTQQIAHTVQQKIEAKEILSIIEQHLGRS